jgi:hypothetical protein
MSKMNQCYGLGQALINTLPPPLLFGNSPGTSDTNFEIGQIVYTGSVGAYTFYIYAGAGIWELLDMATGALDTLSGDSGTATPTAGNIKIAGTTAQVATTASGSTVTVSLIGPYTPATYTAHGVLIGEGASSIVATSAGLAGQLLTSGGASADPTWTTATFPGTVGATGTILRSNGTNWVASTDTYPNTSTAGALIAATATNTIGEIADVATGQALMSGGVGVIPAYSGSPSFSGSVTAATTITATLGNITATNGNLVLSGPGNKLVIAAAAPTTDSVGTTAAMITGAVTITSSAITAQSKIIYSRRTLGTAMGNVSITAQAPGSATLTSDAGTETSTFDYLIIN